MSARRTESQRKTTKVRTAAAGVRATSNPGPTTRVTPEERWQMIAKAAYFRAQKRGFAPGGDVQDWLDAETEVERQLGGR